MQHRKIIKYIIPILLENSKHRSGEGVILLTSTKFMETSQKFKVFYDLSIKILIRVIFQQPPLKIYVTATKTLINPPLCHTGILSQNKNHLFRKLVIYGCFYIFILLFFVQRNVSDEDS